MEEAGRGGEWGRMDFEDFWHCETWNFNRETDEKILFSMRDERLVTLELESFFKQEALVPLDSRIRGSILFIISSIIYVKSGDTHPSTFSLSFARIRNFESESSRNSVNVLLREFANALSIS